MTTTVLYQPYDMPQSSNSLEISEFVPFEATLFRPYNNIIYQSKEKAKDTPNWLCSVYNYCSYNISKAVNKIDERPLYYNALFFSAFSLGALSISSTAAILAAMSVSYSANMVTNYIVNLYGPKSKVYAQIISAAGEAVMSVVCYSIISASVASLVAATPLAVVPATVIAIPVAVVSAMIFTQIRRLQHAIEYSVIDKDRMVVNLDRKYNSNSTDLYNTIITSAFKSVFSSVVLDALQLPSKVGHFFVITSNFVVSDVIDKGASNVTTQDLLLSTVKGAFRNVEFNINNGLSKVFGVESMAKKVAVSTIITMAIKPIEIYLSSVFKEAYAKLPTRIEFCEQVKNEINKILDKVIEAEKNKEKTQAMKITIS